MFALYSGFSLSMDVKMVNLRPLSKYSQPGIMNTPACTRRPLFNTVLFFSFLSNDIY